jgi:RNA-binding protein
MMAPVLTAKERAHLKARAHPLEPTVQIGHGGVTDAVVAEIDRALTTHELIKVRAATADRETRRAWLDTICERTDAAAVQAVGKVMVLWRPRPDGDPAT